MRILWLTFSSRASIYRKIAEIMAVILRKNDSVDLADEAFQVFGFGEIEEDGVVLGCASAFEEGDAAMGVYGGGGYGGF